MYPGNHGNYQGPPYGGSGGYPQPPQDNYGGPPLQDGYGGYPQPPQAGYGGPPLQDGYGGPPPPPHQENYGGYPQDSYSGYSQPQPQDNYSEGQNSSQYDYQASRGFGDDGNGDGYRSGYQMPGPPNDYPGNSYNQRPPPPPGPSYGAQSYGDRPPFPGGGNGMPGSYSSGNMPFPGSGFGGGPPMSSPPPFPSPHGSGEYHPPAGSYGPPRPRPPSGQHGPRNHFPGSYGPPGGMGGSPGGNAGQQFGGAGVPPPMNMPAVRHRPEDIDFAGANFPQWHSQQAPPPPPPGNGINHHGQPMHGNIPSYNIPQEIQQEASSVPLSNCRGRKRALLIGINYIGTKHMLKGCINDVNNMKQFIIQHFGFKEEDMVILTDNQRQNPRRMPTHDNIIKAMKWLVSDARMNDSFFFHFSGHGITVESETSEEIDGKDEAICPLDFETKGTIVDDDMNAIMVRPLPRGARLTAIFDCCHSATALDLPFMYNHMGKLKNEKAISYVGKNLRAAGEMYFQGNLAGAIKGVVKSLDMAVTGDSKLEKSRRTKSTMGDVIMFSGCKDDETSADTKTELEFTGAMSHALKSSMYANPRQTYVELLQDIRRRIISGGYKQVPQLSTGRLMDMNTVFIM
ncbi:Ca(2+)-dependent cysteine protease [Coemansia sp. RSA 989]|nr:Ca(2+)-dependent cysteine protease [Coemansia sp. RSA 1086]KAJ1750834.1 Ca(2+)-dependent cysteine protease [Coemansia sp. RSA 1821]KAJ1862764.1 Ca(2+)-dependent cysteine protease [Coemansia sp. RSA 989]KAJ1872749.1 Ca(2+)-dependent cysteine protease [Coemansia sp. RSA 990]KAJ2669617.1 Ca(2+)-dependent cysteine protease [Coemansia sp. RSA 1085]